MNSIKTAFKRYARFLGATAFLCQNSTLFRTQMCHSTLSTIKRAFLSINTIVHFGITGETSTMAKI